MEAYLCVPPGLPRVRSRALSHAFIWIFWRAFARIFTPSRASRPPGLEARFLLVRLLRVTSVSVLHADVLRFGVGAQADEFPQSHELCGGHCLSQYVRLISLGRYPGG